MRTRIILLTALVWLLFFALGKVVFAMTCGESTITETAIAWWHGLPIDLSTTGYFLSIPLLAVWLSVVFPRLPVGRVLMPWNILCSMLAVAAVVVDASLYPFWGFKLDATILNYIDSPADAMASVSVWFVVWRVLLSVLLVCALSWLLYRVSAHTLKPVGSLSLLAMPFTLALLFAVIRGGVGESTMNVGVSYHSQRMFLNHVAVNPVFSFIASMSRSDDPSKLFRVLPDDECHSLFAELYDVNTTADAVSHESQIISHKSPNVLVILWESGGSSFFAPMGGQKGVMVNLEKIAGEGILFDNMRCASWRTDRGMVATLSGWFAYPTLTLMRMPTVCDRLPCLGRSFARQGYDTFFLYGGDINFTHTAGYLTAGGYNTLIADRDFTLSQQHTEKWGVTDSITFGRLYDEVVERSRSGRPWHGGMLTLSSHEPFEVPYTKYDDKVLNSMAYTDHCLGRFIHRLKGEPDVWNNLLLVILPDHGYGYNGMVRTHPDFFRVPMVWTGGCIQQPQVVSHLMSQSDMAATLLGALGVDYGDYPYSRNVLDSACVYHWAYSASSEFVVFEDSTGRTILNTNTMISDDDSPRLNYLKAVLQASHDALK